MAYYNKQATKQGWHFVLTAEIREVLFETVTAIYFFHFAWPKIAIHLVKHIYQSPTCKHRPGD
ncbi:hypothetical protein A7K99_10450 [Tatumella citrea]|uniref:Uncharacterized protein n=1 Tax=Tatumella citrea TaxID=53336 RepID=A0A1Y0LJB9_TATCI|nr:hypothetical protein A7K98_10450 [Tatumella citrea]ARU98194.1 hypothetical protein A7K99_10450 [Tatumella citrea]